MVTATFTGIPTSKDCSGTPGMPLLEGILYRSQPKCRTRQTATETAMALEVLALVSVSVSAMALALAVLSALVSASVLAPVWASASAVVLGVMELGGARAAKSDLEASQEF